MTRVIYVGGPTASGKSALALELASRFGGEIINADSQQVYRGLDVGTGKPHREARESLPHHLYDFASPGERVDAALWVREAERTIAAVVERGRVPFVVGGTGLWMRALYKGLVDAPPRDERIRNRLEQQAQTEGLASLHRALEHVDPESAGRIHPTDPVRLIRALEVYELTGQPLSALHRAHALGTPRHLALHLAVDWDMAELEKRIARRVDEMFREGLVDETRRLAAQAPAREKLEKVMGYREALALIDGRVDEAQARALIVREHRRYAKRQRTWLRAEDWWTWIAGADAFARALPLVDAFLSAPARVN